MSRLPEIAESAATGSVAETYAEIRRVTGVPFVVFIYRVLATEPGRLEAAWAELAPNLVSAEGRAARAELEAAAPPAAAPRPAPLPRDVVDAAGLTAANVAVDDGVESGDQPRARSNARDGVKQRQLPVLRGRESRIGSGDVVGTTPRPAAARLDQLDMKEQPLEGSAEK